MQTFGWDLDAMGLRLKVYLGTAITTLNRFFFNKIMRSESTLWISDHLMLALCAWMIYFCH